MAHKAPGKHYREGMTLPQLFKMFPDDAAAQAWVEKIRWPNGAECPHCCSANVQHPVKHKTMTHRCRVCRKWFSVRTGSIMQSSKLGLQTWVIAVYLLNTSLKGQSSMKLHRELGITQKSAWHLAHRIREAWDENGGSLFTGPVEADETYIGGKRKNMPKSKRKELKGRGAVGKAAVVGAKDRESNKVVARHIENTDTPNVAGFVARRTKLGSTVYTDESAAYNALAPHYGHEAVNHSIGEYVRGQAHTNGIESFWSMLKRGYQGTYHKMSAKHLDRYVTEFAGRHNAREADTVDQLAGVVAGMRGKRLRYRDLIADNGRVSGARTS